MHHMRYLWEGKQQGSLCYWEESVWGGPRTSTRVRVLAVVLAVHKELSAPPRQPD